MRNASNNIETKTTKTYMTNITRIREVNPVIGKEKKVNKSPNASPMVKQPYSPEK
jgi:hypothetical protein